MAEEPYAVGDPERSRLSFEPRLFAPIPPHEHDRGSPAGLEPGSLEGHGESGRGLAIVDALCECWGVDPTADGKTVWFQLRQPDGDDG